MPPKVSSPLRSLKSFYFRYERMIGSVALVWGFIFNALTLKRVDILYDNLWTIGHMVIAATALILLHINETRTQRKDDREVADKKKITPTNTIGNKNNSRDEDERAIGEKTLRSEQIHFWLILAIQFSFGGLLSTFLVFYFRSATIATSWPFLLLLAVAFASNEIFKERYSRLTFQVSVLYISLISFAIFFIPIILHEISTKVFIISGIISLIGISLYIALIRFIAREQFQRKWWRLFFSIGGIYVLINILYFTNIIPPLPLSLKSAGVYHSITKNSAGNYDVVEEQTNWTDFFKPNQIYHAVAGESVYVYSAIFSPTALNTQIVHHWQYFNEKTQKWVTVSRIPLPIVGGRDKGYRTYTYKTNIFPARWRVDVETGNGQHIGRIKFIVEFATSTVTHTIEVK